jgi:WhiB family transcriptional regulator, redox-sensing transcriptional regulator
MVDDDQWRDRASCSRINAVYFFPPGHFERKPEKDDRENHARELCASCPVRAECLEHALAIGETHGIWGGLNELERRRLRRRLSVEATTVDLNSALAYDGAAR